MKQRLFILVLLLSSLLLAIQVQAQARTPWSAWLYEQATGTMTLVNQDGGILDTFVLPSEVGYSYSRNVSVSDNGNLFAYVVSDGVAPFNGYLYIYDRAADTVRYAFDMGPTPTHSLDFVASNLNFSADGGLFAFGYANSDMSRWWALVIDLTTFDVPYGIRSTDPLAVNTGLPDQFLLPVVQFNRDGEVIFNPVRLATEGFSEYDAWTWNLTDTSLTPNPVYRVLSNDTLPTTGEVIMALPDDRFPYETTEEYAYFQSQTLQVYDPTVGGRYPFYADENMFYYEAEFIQGGERVLAAAFDVDGANIWSVIDRSGALVGTLPTINVMSPAGVLDGFIFTSNDLDSERRPQLLYVQTRDGLNAGETGTPVWTGTEREAVVTVVWSSDVLITGTPPLAAWARLAEPIDPLELPTNNDEVRAIDGVLTVGGQASVNTTSGDVLNVRSGAGTSFAIVATLNAGDVVTLLEGPVIADGFTWWRLRTAGGAEGWAVEQIDDNGTPLQTLLPI